MIKSPVRIVAILAVVVSMVIPVMAKPVTKSMTLDTAVMLAGTQLAAGDYKMSIDGDKITFEKGGKAVATVNGSWEDRKQKQVSTGFLTENNQVQEIYIAGDSRAFVVGSR
jgi:hypothetical protein